MGEGSPLDLLEKNGGKVLLLGVDYPSNTFHHVVEMSDCRKVIEGLLRKGIKGFPGCKSCKIRPRIYPETVKSDLTADLTHR